MPPLAFPPEASEASPRLSRIQANEIPSLVINNAEIHNNNRLFADPQYSVLLIFRDGKAGNPYGSSCLVLLLHVGMGKEEDKGK